MGQSGKAQATGAEDLIRDIESMKHMLIAYVTDERTEKAEFVPVRRRLIGSNVSAQLPRFVHTCRTLEEFWGFIKPQFAKYDERRAFIREAFAPLLTELERAPAPADVIAASTIERLSSVYVNDQWQKALARRETDADGALTIARSLLESVCKHILEDAGRDYPDNADLPALYALLSKELSLAPEQHAHDALKRILGGCTTVVRGLGELRNGISDAHGKGRVHFRPLPRHSELAVNLAGATAMFLVATFEARQAEWAEQARG